MGLKRVNIQSHGFVDTKDYISTSLDLIIASPDSADQNPSKNPITADSVPFLYLTIYEKVKHFFLD